MQPVVLDLDAFDKVVRGDPKLGYKPGGLQSLDFQIVLSRIPPLFGLSPKATYLALRSIGISSKEALRILKIERRYLTQWREDDEIFAYVETEKLPELQKSCGPNIVRLKFMRNAMLLYELDTEIIVKASEEGISELEDREWQWLRQVRAHYNPADLLALEKAIAPEKHHDRPVIQLTWGNSDKTIPEQLQEAEEATFRLLETSVEGVDNGSA